jgi:hypothetical protein
MLQWLMDALKERFPDATIIVKRGGDAFFDMARIAYANTSILSASSFSLFPALATNGTAYFPPSPFTPPANVTLRPEFHWLEEPHLISSGWPSPWYLIKYALFEETITAKTLEKHAVKVANARAVYWVEDGVKHMFNSGSDFEAMGLEWGDVWTVDYDLLQSIPLGDPVVPHKP